MKYLSVCSGIEAASVAWHPLGWSPTAFAEIEKFPGAVLAHHYPDVPNFGDMTKFKEWPDAAFDVLVGGTPCQSFSVAGLRQGLADPRGNLALTYLALLDRYRPEWFIWENVPGVLSLDDGRAFGSILGGVAKLGYGFAYRVLDAQFVRVDGFGRAVPQRRRRVFVVGNSRDWRRAAAVLFERESLSWNSAPRRKTGERVAPTISARPTGGGGLGTDFDLDGGLIPNVSRPLLAKGNDSFDDTLQTYIGRDVSHCLNAGGMGRQDYETETVIAVAHALRGEGFDASEDGTGRRTPLVPVREAIAFDCKASGQSGFGVGEIASTLRAMGHSDSHQNGGGMLAVAIQERAISENAAAGPDGIGVRDDGAAYTLEARQVPQAVAFAQNTRDEVRLFGGDGQTVGALAAEPGMKQTAYVAQAFDMRGREGGAQFEGPHDTANIRAASGGSSKSYVAQAWAVRRLTPTECERLQGFPDGYTNVPWRGKDFSPDGPRYKALGNSMAVNVMRWLGRRIDLVSKVAAETVSEAAE